MLGRQMLVLSMTLGCAMHCGSSAKAAEPRIDFTLVHESGFPIGGARNWIELVKKVKNSSVRIRAARSGDEITVTEGGTDAARIYRVTGLLTSKNTLQVPGAEFRRTDIGRFRQWAAKLAQGGLEGVTGKRNAFGLSSKDLVRIHAVLAPPVSFSTKEEQRIDALRRITRSLSVKTKIDSSAVEGLSAPGKVGEELKGISCGTALAILLRPQGLALSVNKSGGSIQLLVADYRSVREAWPTGWPLKKKSRDAIPELFKFLEAEIRDIPLSDALTAIQPRLKVPVLYDHNSLAAEEIEPAEIKVSVPPGRTYYKRIIDRALAQAKLKAELRMDEGERAFLWVTTIRDVFGKNRETPSRR